MKCSAEFRDPGLAAALLKKLDKLIDRPVRIMEVCGTHTNAIFRHGLRSLLPETIELISGPGCPVCVTPSGHIDSFIAAARIPGVTVATFGHLIRVPGSTDSLAHARAEGARVEIVYSPMDALTLAEKCSGEKIVFPAIGFETTTPTIAATIMEAARRGIDNFFVVSAGKIMPPPLEALMSDPDLHVDGLLCPGHVSAIIGSNAYLPLVEKYALCCAVAGFEPADILSGLVSIAQQRFNNSPAVENCYTRAVSPQGNARAQSLTAEVFQVDDSPWRGLGVIPKSGLILRNKYRRYDAIEQLGITVQTGEEPKGCRCGEILKGSMSPPDCPLYGTRCTPLRPVGPCMVSNEGSCAAFYRYTGIEKTGTS